MSKSISVITKQEVEDLILQHLNMIKSLCRMYAHETDYFTMFHMEGRFHFWNDLEDPDQEINFFTGSNEEDKIYEN